MGWWFVKLHAQASDYTWVTYKEVYDDVMKLAASIDKSGIKQVLTARNYLNIYPFYNKVL
jgi:hypothetical protein